MEGIAAAPKGEDVSERNPRIDPQPGDELRGDNFSIRRVIQREADTLLIERWKRRNWILVQTWQKWCKQSRIRVVRQKIRKE